VSRLGTFGTCRKTGFAVTSGRGYLWPIMRPVDHGGAVQGDRSDAKENWGQARLSQERAAPVRS
jgi:hypothetical protein